MHIPIRSKQWISILLVLLFSPALLTAESLDTLLNDFSQKNDTSQKTIDENKGHLILYTRDKIERMHARTLKDILKTVPVIQYSENRYAVPDPLGGTSVLPFASNLIRLYIDGAEITHGWFGSGISIYGDMNLDFADHIEFYYGTPSFESSPESAYLSIFVYSKDPGRDAGGKVTALYGSRGYNGQSFTYLDEVGDYRYMLSVSHTDADKAKVPNDSPTPLSRDYEKTQIFGYLKSEHQTAHLQLITKDTDSLAGMSWDATPELAKADYTSLHMDYGIDFNPHWSAKLSYGRTKLDNRQKDNFPLIFSPPFVPMFDINSEMKASSLTAELTYKNNVGDHALLTGIKSRKKELLSYKLNGVEMPLPLFHRETIHSFFFQDQYSLSEKHLLSLGLSYSYIDRTGDKEDTDFWQGRLGYIYADPLWSFKTYLFGIKTPKDPVAINLMPGTDSRPLVQSSLGCTAEVAYRDDIQNVRLVVMKMQGENELLFENLLPLHPDLKTDYFSAFLNYQYHFGSDNSLGMQLHYDDFKNDFYKAKIWGGNIMLSNTYKAFEFFNSLVWNWDSDHHNHYFDLNTAVTWNASPDLSFTLKGENLLNKGSKTDIFRLNPISGLPMAPLAVPVSDRRITLEAEYKF